MAQVGNFHIGSPNSVIKPKLSYGEAYAIWDNLAGRYDLLEILQVFSNFAHDKDLKELIEHKIISVMQPQIEALEKSLIKHEIPLPPRPPKNIKFQANSGIARDEFIFRRLFSLIQDFINVCAVSIKVMVVNDEERDVFRDYLMDKIVLFDYLCDFGIKKGWLEIPPLITGN